MKCRHLFLALWFTMCSKGLSKYKIVTWNTMWDIAGLPKGRGSLQGYNHLLSTSTLRHSRDGAEWLRNREQVLQIMPKTILKKWSLTCKGIILILARIFLCQLSRLPMNARWLSLWYLGRDTYAHQQNRTEPRDYHGCT